MCKSVCQERTAALSKDGKRSSVALLEKMTSFSAVVKTEAGKELAKASTSTEPHWSDGCAEKTFKSEEPIEPPCLLSLINSLTLK